MNKQFVNIRMFNGLK